MINKVLKLFKDWIRIPASQLYPKLLIFIFAILGIIGFYLSRQWDHYQIPVEVTTLKSRSATPRSSELKSVIKEQRLIDKNQFDLNSVNDEDLNSYSIPEFLSKRIIKYRDHVKKFDSVGELKKIYGLSEKHYLVLSQYAYVTDRKISSASGKESYNYSNFKTKKDSSGSRFEFKNTSKEAKREFKTLNLDINSADTTALKAIYGIGSITAKRIVDYRERLGGFISEGQFKNIYLGRDTTRYRILKENCFINENFKPKKVSISRDSIKIIARHPFISYKEAQILKAYSNAHPELKDIKEYSKIYGIKEDRWNRMQPYLGI